MPHAEVSNTLDTAERLTLAVESVNIRHGDADLCILAGDLADLGEGVACERLRDLIALLSVDTRLMLGNHDDRPTVLSVWGAEHADENGHVQQVIDIKGHRVTLLDSSEPGVLGGVQCDKRLGWTRRATCR